MPRRPTPPADQADQSAEPAVEAMAANLPADSPEPPKDSYEARFKETQRAFHAQARAFAEYRATHPDIEPDEDELDDDDIEQAPSRFRTVQSARPRIPEAAHDAEAAELGRSVAEAVHGADVVADYDRAMQLLQNATTTADRVTAFQAFADLRARSASASSAPRRTPSTERLQTRDQQVTPTVQTNRPDGPMYVDETDPGRYAGGQNGGVKGYVRALLGRGGER